MNENNPHNYGSGKGVAAFDSQLSFEQKKINYKTKEALWMKKGLTKKQSYQMIKYGRLYA